MAALSSTIASAQAAPFFLVGSERSGTTLLRLMLAHHARIECAPEFEFLVEPIPAQGWPALADVYEWLSTNRIFLPHALEIDRTLDYPALMKSFVTQYGKRSKKPLHGATCHKHFDRLLRIWPEARLVHLLRDGRDVARSCIGMGWAGNVWFGAQRWIEAEELWAALAPRLPAAQRYELRYEDLIRDPERQLAQLCAFLGTDYDAGMLDYSRDSSYERPDPKLIGQWKQKLTPAELALLEARIGPLLRARGYEESGVAPAEVGGAQRFALSVQDRLARFSFRRQRYGLAHLAQARLARTLNLSAWQRRLLCAQNEIDNRHLQ
ncbi:MAG: sulfotransferase [Planctomycetes bacterium]|nr:sulfotransferase [Planctomycetota bacterium]